MITGCANGIGRGCAERFASEGWTVVGIDVDEAGLDDMRSRLGQRIDAHVCDVRDVAALMAVAQQVVADPVGRFAVVNVAGIYPESALESATEALYKEIFDTNVWGPIATAQAFTPHLNCGDGIVLNIASIDGLEPAGGQLLYGASKAAVVSVTRSLAVELGPRGVRSIAVAPGWVNTLRNPNRERSMAALARVPLRRAATPEEIAGVVYALCADRAFGYVTGATLAVAGGVVLY